MVNKKSIIAINGSASKNSTNLALLKLLAAFSKEYFELIIIESLNHLPHFQTELSLENTPQVILEFRKQIQESDGILICTPEYVFSIPSGLKNALEWCVSTTVFSNKPCALITASASGEKAHEELQLIMKTIEAIFTADTTSLIQGIKGKINKQGQIKDQSIIAELERLIMNLNFLIKN